MDKEPEVLDVKNLNGASPLGGLIAAIVALIVK